MNGRWTADVRQMVADARAGSDKSLHIYLYTNNARCVAGRLSEGHINRQRVEGGGETDTGRWQTDAVRRRERKCSSAAAAAVGAQACSAGAHAFVGGGGGRVKKYLFKICNGVIVEWWRVACFGQRAGGRPSKQSISRDAGLVGVHWAFGVQTKG